MPQKELEKYLPAIGDGDMLTGESPDVSMVAVGPPGSGMYMVSSTDFFSPITQDPYRQGRIAAANTLSDLYALGISRVDNMLMILAVSNKMVPEHKEIVTRRMISGFNDACSEAGTKITGGQTVRNPWPLIGGVAMSVVSESAGDFVRATGAQPGDVAVLTKPLGSQISGNLAIWMMTPERWAKAAPLIDVATASRAVTLGEQGMMRLNRGGAQAMQELGADCHGATDVTGFGLLGHANNLAQVQKYRGAEGDRVDIVLHTLPVIQGLLALDQRAVTVDYGLRLGTSAETSGGLLVLMAPSAVERFQARLKAIDGPDAESWVVGDVVAGGSGSARLVESGVRCLEV